MKSARGPTQRVPVRTLYQATMKRSDATGQLVVIRQASVMEALRRIGWQEETASGLGMASDVIWYCGVQDPDDQTFLQRRAAQQINRLPRMQGIVSKNAFAEAMSAASAEANNAHCHPPSVCITARDSAAAQVRQFLVAHGVAGAVQRTDAEAQAAHVVSDGAEAVQQQQQQQHAQEWIIIKNDVGRCGDGIQIVAASDVARLLEVALVMAPCVLQHYIAAPLLYQRRKFDLRVYVLVLCAEEVPAGFRAFLFRDGLARVCSEEYEAPTAANCRRTFMHLTNYSINKSSGAAVQLKLKASALLQHLQHALLLPPLWPLVAECCASTMRALLPKHVHDMAALGMQLQGLFHVLGADVMFELQAGAAPVCHVLEVNVNPSMTCESEADREVKLQLLVDTFKAASRPGQCPATFEQLV